MDKIECCPEFDPEPWYEQEIVWDNKKFVTGRVRSFLHIPLNFGKVIAGIMTKIESSNAECGGIVLADEDSPWGSNIFVDVTEDVEECSMTAISGTFLTKVFEGPFKEMKNWIEDMNTFVTSKGHKSQMLYFYYTTCPKCAKKYGKNYVVLLSKVK